MNIPWSYTGLPTVSMPVSLSPDGLPLAVLLTGRQHGDAALLRMAKFCEAILSDQAR